MNAEQLHDAISLLPPDLIAETEKKRRAPASPRRWQRFAAMAACFALMVCGSVWCFSLLRWGGVGKAAAQTPAALHAPAEEAAPAAPQAEAAAQDRPLMKNDSAQSSTTVAGSTVSLLVEGIPRELSEEDRLALAELLQTLAYRKDAVCECSTEITATVDGIRYQIHPEEGFVRCADGQARLTPGQTSFLKRLCGGE